VSLEWNCGALAEGIGCYRRGEFFLAHEHWESVWLTLAEPEKSFLQALIQIAAAFHHFEAGNFAGAASLLRRALRRLSLSPACFGGIDVASLRAEVSGWLGTMESGTPGAYPQIRPVDQAAG